MMRLPSLFEGDQGVWPKVCGVLNEMFYIRATGEGNKIKNAGWQCRVTKSKLVSAVAAVIAR